MVDKYTIKKVVNSKIDSLEKDTLKKCKFLILFLDGTQKWLFPNQINLKIIKNQRKIESYIKKIANKNEQSILANGYNGSGKKYNAQKTENKSPKKRNKKQNIKKKKSLNKFIQAEPIDENILIEEVLNYEILQQNEDFFQNDILNKFKFQVRMKNQKIYSLTTSQINFQIKNNKDIVCRFIQDISNLEDFLTISKINHNGAFIFTDFLGQNGINWKALKESKKLKISQNEEEKQQDTQENLENECQFSKEKDLEQMIFQNNDQENFSEAQISQNQDYDIEQNKDLFMPKIFQDKNEIIQEAKNLFYQGYLYKKLIQSDNYLFKNKEFKIYNQRNLNGDNLIDGLNIFCENYLFTEREQLRELFIDRKFQQVNVLLENQNMKGFSLINFSQIIFDPIKICFLTPMQIGVVERDQIEFYLSLKLNITDSLLIGKEKPYIFQYYDKYKQKVGCAIVKYYYNQPNLYDNSLTGSIVMRKQTNNLLEWMKNIEVIEIYQMQSEIDEEQEEFIRKVKHWYKKVIKQQIPVKIKQFFEKQKKIQGNK